MEHALEATQHVVRPGSDWARRGGGKGGKGGGDGGGKGGKGDGGCDDFRQGRCSRGAACKFAHAAPAAAGFGGGMGGGLGGGMGGGMGGGLPPRDADDEALGPSELALRYPWCSAGTHKALAALDHSAIDYELVVQVLLGSRFGCPLRSWA